MSAPVAISEFRASRKEKRWEQLQKLASDCVITALRRRPERLPLHTYNRATMKSLPILLKGIPVLWTADFAYMQGGEDIQEVVRQRRSVDDGEYEMKKAIAIAEYGIVVKEWR